jgi:hypothetical protein
MQSFGSSIWENIQPALHQFALAAFLIYRFDPLGFVMNEPGLDLQRIRALAQGLEIRIKIIEHSQRLSSVFLLKTLETTLKESRFLDLPSQPVFLFVMNTGS